MQTLLTLLCAINGMCLSYTVADYSWFKIMLNLMLILIEKLIWEIDMFYLLIIYFFQVQRLRLKFFLILKRTPAVLKIFFNSLMVVYTICKPSLLDSFDTLRAWPCHSCFHGFILLTLILVRVIFMYMIVL